MMNPCKGCTDRTITCHGVCKKYQAWKKEDEEKKKWLREQNPPINESALKNQRKRIKDKSRGWKRRGAKNYE